jgi:hypothetical protein
MIRTSARLPPVVGSRIAQIEFVKTLPWAPKDAQSKLDFAQWRFARLRTVSFSTLI